MFYGFLKVDPTPCPAPCCIAQRHPLQVNGEMVYTSGWLRGGLGQLDLVDLNGGKENIKATVLQSGNETHGLSP